MWVMLMLACSFAHARELNGSLLDEMKSRLADDSQRQAAIYAGQDRAVLCGYCHGTDGNSLRPDVPNLAGQNPVYLLEQINKFATGERKDYVMNSLAGEFTANDQISLAIFYSLQVIKPASVNQRQASRGKGIYQKNCQSCHGEKGLGKKNFARLAGQKEAYTIKTLQRFRGNGAKHTTTGQAKRRNQLMESVTRQLSDQDIESLAAYVAQLR